MGEITRIRAKLDSLQARIKKTQMEGIKDQDESFRKQFHKLELDFKNIGTGTLFLVTSGKRQIYLVNIQIEDIPDIMKSYGIKEYQVNEIKTKQIYEIK